MTNKDLAMQESEAYLSEKDNIMLAQMFNQSNPFNEISDYIQKTIESAESGWDGYLDSVITLRKAKEFFDDHLKMIKEFEDQYQSEIEQEASEYQNEYQGVKFEFRNGGKIFNFKGISEIEEAERQVKELKEKYQSAWENKQRGLLAVSEDGEELQLPSISYRKSSMIVKLPK